MECSDVSEVDSHGLRLTNSSKSATYAFKCVDYFKIGPGLFPASLFYSLPSL